MEPLLSTCLFIWGTLTVIFIILEMNTVALVSIWFVVGALAAMVAAAQGMSFLNQNFVFVGVSVFSFLVTRPFVRSLKIKIIPTNSDEIVGAEGVVLTEVDNVRAQGRVMINNIDWAAKSTAGTVIPEGVVVRVDRLEGVTVFVTRKSEHEA